MGTPYDGLYGEAPPERGNFCRLQVYERLGISLLILKYGCIVLFQVMFLTGAKVEISRNAWGIDILLFTPRAKNAANESGLCLDRGNENSQAFGDKWR